MNSCPGQWHVGGPLWGQMCPSSHGCSQPAPCPGGLSSTTLSKLCFHPKMEPEQRLLGRCLAGAGSASGGAPCSQGTALAGAGSGTGGDAPVVCGVVSVRPQTPQGRSVPGTNRVPCAGPLQLRPHSCRAASATGGNAAGQRAQCARPPRPRASPSSPIAKLNAPFQPGAPGTPWPPPPRLPGAHWPEAGAPPASFSTACS